MGPEDKNEEMVVYTGKAEFRRAMRWAEKFNRPLANRYHHTKKKRTRKKYAKRILAWYRTEVIGVGE